MRKLALSLTTVAAVATPLLAVTAPAEAYAGTPGCVTTTEYRSITTGVGRGLTQLQVARRFGTYARPYWGHITYSSSSSDYTEIDREYRPCNSAGKPMSSYRGYVEVDFSNTADFEHYTASLRSTYKVRTIF
ncbi:MAG TPA: hypothetical protein VM688_08260 [Nocardioidaceae bacterium]|nr:hypothetical protein [Nocardioidaceae bacterium]